MRSSWQNCNEFGKVARFTRICVLSVQTFRCYFNLSSCYYHKKLHVRHSSRLSRYLGTCLLYKMELLNTEELTSIASQFGFSNVIRWHFEEFPERVIGYLGDHLKLFIDVEADGTESRLNLFVKCMPRFDKWKAEYLKELNFFKKEFIMLSSLFKEFQNNEGSQKWRPKLYLIKETIFVMENVTFLGYKMPHHRNTMTFNELKASVETLARFHAQSYIFEERKSEALKRPYRINEDYGDYLQEPRRGLDWRDAGRNAVIDYLHVYSKYKSKANFGEHIQLIITQLFDNAMELMKPSLIYRNAVVHRDLWTNNIFLQKEQNSYHALFVDFQTVLYCSPMLDLSSFIYFNTTKSCRTNYTDQLIDYYYDVLSEVLKEASVNIDDVFDKTNLFKSYEENIVFAITQAALITPIIAMDSEKREQIFCDPESARRANVVSRSKEFIDIAKEDEMYRVRITELLDEVVERYIYPEDVGINVELLVNA